MKFISTLILTICLFTFVGLNAQQIGEPAPWFTILDEDGNRFTNEEYKGKVVYVTFWASWCADCKRIMDNTRQLRKDIEKEGVVLLNISLDKDKQKWQDAIFVNDVFGDNKIMESDRGVQHTFGIKTIPKFYIIDKNGNLAALSGGGREKALEDFKALVAQ